MPADEGDGFLNIALGEMKTSEDLLDHFGADHLVTVKSGGFVLGLETITVGTLVLGGFGSFTLADEILGFHDPATIETAKFSGGGFANIMKEGDEAKERIGAGTVAESLKHVSVDVESVVAGLGNLLSIEDFGNDVGHEARGSEKMDAIGGIGGS